jgi:hypothetical protein
MATLSVTRDYNDGDALTEAQLDSAFDSIETFLNTTKINADNLQDGAVTSDKIGATAVSTAKLANGAVTTAKIEDAAITKAKLASLGQQESSTISFNSSSSTITQISGSTVSFTATGRPVLVKILPVGTTEALGSESTVRTASNNALLSFRRDSTVIGVCALSQSGVKNQIPLEILDTPPAGTYTYSLYLLSDGAGNTVLSNVKLVVIPL